MVELPHVRALMCFGYLIMCVIKLEDLIVTSYTSCAIRSQLSLCKEHRLLKLHTITFINKSSNFVDCVQI